MSAFDDKHAGADLQRHQVALHHADQVAAPLAHDVFHAVAAIGRTLGRIADQATDQGATHRAQGLGDPIATGRGAEDPTGRAARCGASGAVG